MTEQLLSPAAAAKFLAMSVKTLRGHVQDGSIRFIQTGRGLKRPGIAFAPSDLAEFIDKRRTRTVQVSMTSRVTVKKRTDPTFSFTDRLKEYEDERQRKKLEAQATRRSGRKALLKTHRPGSLVRSDP